MRRPISIAVTAMIVALPAWSQHEGHGGAEALGRVSFPTSCAPAVQADFDRAVAMLHSFWFVAAQATFDKVAAADPTCPMAHWGVAMTTWSNPFVMQPLPAARHQAGLAAAQRALALASRATHRERMYIAAAAALWEDAGTLDHVARSRRHEDRMKALYEAHPDDPEAAMFYARAIIANAPPTDLEFKRQLYAATLLEPLFEKQPDHPGLAHYIIHTFDAPKLAQHGLAAARRYAAIAPSAPHALHMPSHIFTRLGHWDESIETNRRSAAAQPDPNAVVHPNDYMVYGYLQQGRDAEAWRVVAGMREAADLDYGTILGYNAAAIPARYALERSAWKEATALTVPEKAAPFVEAIPRFARAIGAARSGNTALAKSEIAVLDALRDTLEARNDSHWATTVEAQRLAASAWVARAEGRNDDAVRLARQAAELEETVEKHPITPGPLLPARELEGDLLMELGRPADALRSYEMTLVREPRRARALFGAARAAEKAGNGRSARGHYEQLSILMARADSSRVEARLAREFLSRGT